MLLLVNEMKHRHYKTLRYTVSFAVLAANPYLGLCYSQWHFDLYICSLLSKGLHPFVFLCINLKKGSVEKDVNKWLDWFVLPSVRPYKAVWSAIANVSPPSTNYDPEESNLASLAWWRAPCVRKRPQLLLGRLLFLSKTISAPLFGLGCLPQLMCPLINQFISEDTSPVLIINEESSQWR